MLVHMKIKNEHILRIEEILRDLMRQTRKHEKNCLHYEYWRATEGGQYYTMLSFPDSTAFYEHQEPPRASATPLPADVPANLKQQEKIYPIDLQVWWTGNAAPHVKG